MANDNNAKDRKSKAQENFEAADNAGRFAGNDADANAARKQAEENIRMAGTGQQENQQDGNRETTNKDAARDYGQAHDIKGEAQNINDDTGRPLTDEEAEQARNKANEGKRQGRRQSDR